MKECAQTTCPRPHKLVNGAESFNELTVPKASVFCFVRICSETNYLLAIVQRK